MLFLNNFLKFLFLMTPFFVLSMFLSMTGDWEAEQKKKLALKVGFASFSTCVILLFFGKFLFDAFGVTLDAFRIGGGALLFLSAVGLVNGNITDKKPSASVQDPGMEISNIAVVPLAIPITVGPGTIGALLIIGAENGSFQAQLFCVVSLAAAVGCLTGVLVLASWLEQKLGRRVILILSKLTGLILAAMAAQMVFTGIRGFLK